MTMREEPSITSAGSDIDRARRIEAICRRFEADWREGRRPRIEDYGEDLPEHGRRLLRAELEALERELNGSDATTSGSAGGLDAASARSASSAITDATTIAPERAPDTQSTAVDDSGGRSPGDEATVDQLPAGPAPADRASSARIRYFGDYEIVREIARGGMGVVFQARQMTLKRTVALKMILAGQLADDTDVKRFHTEAEAAANLDHPGIVPIFEVGQHEGQHYFSMGFVDGQSLSQRLSEGPLPSGQAAALMVKVARAIEYAHQHGVIHRDLKPANILLDQSGNPRVTDFGLAKKVRSDSGLTGSGQIMGTPSYMPPEQAGGRRGEVGPAADVYALGATLYCLVTGRPPFQAATAMDTVIQVISDEPVPPRRLNASIPRDLETICLKCLEKAPGKRYASASNLADDLERYLAGRPIVARPVTSFERAFKWATRKPAIAALLGLVTLVTALGLGGVLWQWRRAVQARNEALAREQDAREAQAREKVQTELARERLLDSIKARTKEREQTELAEQRLYDVRMNLVQRNWEDYNGVLLHRGLEDVLPASAETTDRRGFEWYYWRRKIASGHVIFNPEMGPVGCVAFSPDGRILGCAGSELTLCDALTGRKIHTLTGHKEAVATLVFSPDGKRLATAGANRTGADVTVTWWDTGTGQVATTVVIKQPMVLMWTGAFSPDGKRLAASVTENGQIKVWDTTTGAETLTLTGHSRKSDGLAFSPDGRTLASASDDGTVRVWDALSGRELRVLTGHRGVVYKVAYSPDGLRLASASSDKTLRMWDPATGQELHTFEGHDRGVTDVVFSPDGKRLASSSDDWTIKIWDAASGAELHTFKAHTERIARLAFSPDGKRLASTSGDQTVKFWDTAQGQDTLTLNGHRGYIYGLAFSPDATRLASASVDRTVKLWDTSTGREIHTLGKHTRDVNTVAFSPDGRSIASGSWDGAVKIWNAETGQETLSVVGGHLSKVLFSTDGKLLGLGSVDYFLRVWDAANGKETSSIKGSMRGVMSIALGPGQKRVATVSMDATVKIWDVGTGRIIRTFSVKDPSTLLSAVAYSPDGCRVAAAGSNGIVTIWNADTEQEIQTLRAHTGLVYSLAYSPAGDRLATGNDFGRVNVWDTATGLETLNLKGQIGNVSAVAFSPDGRILASGSDDGSVKLWDARTLDSELAKAGASSH
jgi:eukaryotic-like serine/threonine-protein kinase